MLILLLSTCCVCVGCIVVHVHVFCESTCGIHFRYFELGLHFYFLITKSFVLSYISLDIVY